jgi:malate synthase
MSRIQISGLAVDSAMHDFIVKEALPGTGISEQAFFDGLAGLVRDLAPKNKALLKVRDDLQAKIDAWHKARKGQKRSAICARLRPPLP